MQVRFHNELRPVSSAVGRVRDRLLTDTDFNFCC